MKGKDGTKRERISDKKDAEYVKVIRKEAIWEEETNCNLGKD